MTASSDRVVEVTVAVMKSPVEVVVVPVASAAVVMPVMAVTAARRASSMWRRREFGLPPREDGDPTPIDIRR